MSQVQVLLRPPPTSLWRQGSTVRFFIFIFPSRLNLGISQPSQLVSIDDLVLIFFLNKVKGIKQIRFVSSIGLRSYGVWNIGDRRGCR